MNPIKLNKIPRYEIILIGAKEYETKELLTIFDEDPLVNMKQLQFWQWISSYYMCNLSDVMNAALPSSFKLASESKVIVHPEFDGVIEELSTDEDAFVDVLLQNEELAVSEVISSLNSSMNNSAINYF